MAHVTSSTRQEAQCHRRCQKALCLDGVRRSLQQCLPGRSIALQVCNPSALAALGLFAALHARQDLQHTHRALKIPCKRSAANPLSARCVAGMTYLRYANLCADMLRNALKEPHKAKAQARQVITYKYSPYSDGKQMAAPSE